MASSHPVFGIICRDQPDTFLKVLYTKCLRLKILKGVLFAELGNGKKKTLLYVYSSLAVRISNISHTHTVHMPSLWKSVQGYKQKRGFIIAQAPMKSTCRDFWKMVYEKECGVIVMLSDLVENGEVGRTEIYRLHILLFNLVATVTLL